MKHIGQKESLVATLKRASLPILGSASLFCAPAFADEAEVTPETTPTELVDVVNSTQDTNAEDLTDPTVESAVTVVAEESTEEAVVADDVAVVVEESTEDAAVADDVAVVVEESTEDAVVADDVAVVAEESTEDAVVADDVAVVVEESTEDAAVADDVAVVVEESTEDAVVADDVAVVAEESTEDVVVAEDVAVVVEESTEEAVVADDVAVVVEESTEEVVVADDVAVVVEESTEDVVVADDVAVVVEESTEEAVVAEDVAVVAEESTEDAVVAEESTEDSVVADDVAVVAEESTEDSVVADDVAVVVEESTEEALPCSVTAEQIIACGDAIIDTLDDGFGWADIPVIIKNANEIFSSVANLDQASMKEAVVQVVDYVIDHTDTPWLADGLMDPVFKAIVPVFADVFFNDDVSEAVKMDIPSEAIENQDFSHVADLIIAQFDDGFQWKDLAYVVAVAVKFGVEMENLPWEVRGDAMKRVVDVVLEKTDTPYLPDQFSDLIFRTFADSLIDLMIADLEAADQS